MAVSAAVVGYGHDARADEPPTVAAAAPLRVESDGSRGQRVSIEGSDGACDTPCILMLPPGDHTLVSSGRGIRTGHTPVSVPAGGLTVRLREPTRAGFVGGVVLMAFGEATLTLGTVFVIGIAASSASDPYNQTMMGVVGGMTLAIGVPSLAVGVWMMLRHRTGIESTAAATVPATAWSVVPTVGAGGAGGLLRVTF